MYYKSKNKGIRCPIKSSPLLDVNVSGFSVEKTDKNSPVISNADFGFYTVRLILSGLGYAEYKNITYTLVPDTLLVTYPNMDVNVVQDKTDPYTMAWFVCDGIAVKQLLQKIGVTEQNFLIKLNHDEKLHKLFRETPYACKKNIEYSDVIAVTAFYEFILCVLSQTVLPSTAETVKSSYHVQAAIQYIADHFSDVDISVNSVARSIGVSPKYLSRIFKEETGLEMNKFITNKRLTLADALMLDKQMNIQQIAEKCGFSSPYYFSRVYKKYNTVPPSVVISERKKES